MNSNIVDNETASNAASNETAAVADKPQTGAEPGSTGLPERIHARRKMRVLTPLNLLLIAAALAAGILIGALVVRQRAHARDIIVSVNGKIITSDQFYHRLQLTNGMPTMRKLVEEELQMQFAESKGLAPTDTQVDTQYAKLIQQPGFEQMKNASGETESDLKKGLRLQMAQTNVLTQGVTVTEADARRYYQTQVDPRNPNAQYYRPDTVIARAIETLTRGEADKAEAELATETPFGLVAMTYSQDASKNNGGVLSPLARGRSPLRTDPALEQAIFALKIGQRLGPVMFKKRWWIFECADKSPMKTLPYEQVKDQCLIGAKLTKGIALNSAKVQSDFLAFQSHSNLQAFWKNYQAALSTK